MDADPFSGDPSWLGKWPGWRERSALALVGQAARSLADSVRDRGLKCQNRTDGHDAFDIPNSHKEQLPGVLS